ncbi:MAG: phage tail protein I, partial [Oscillospiraceae bacterium]|nr:phage tail protein I [Oscillospiraceae bacterium]
MNPAYGITPENLLRILPDVLKNDESMLALANAIIGVLAGQPDDIEEVMIYTRIDKLPEPLLDILAYDFKVDWWDANYTLAEKRRVLKESWAVRRRLGTKAAVQRAVSAIFDDTLVQEWFEYGGQ